MPNNLRKKFAIFKHNRGLVYLDSAATSQLPESVISVMNKFMRQNNANIHRGQYELSLSATNKYEAAREVVKKWLDADSNYEAIFTAGATAALNQVIFGLKPFIKKGQCIVVSTDNHHSNFVGWQRLAREVGARLVVVPVHRNGRLDLTAFRKAIKDKPAVVAISHVSNVTGVVHPVNEICNLAQKAGSISVIDGAQAVAHLNVSLSKMKADFYAFSAHKMYGPTGVGVLIGRSELLQTMEPLLTGGGMITEVTEQKTSWAPLPQKFEAGTQNIVGVIGLGAAVTWWHKHSSQAIWTEEEKLTKYLLHQLSKIEPVEIIGPTDLASRIGVVSLKIKNLHAHDLAEILADQQVAVRAGHHCTMPLHRLLNLEATLRVSLGAYNTPADIDKFITALKIAIAKLS